jgi:hypothetical protein
VFMSFRNKFKNTKHVAVICNGNCRHIMLNGLLIETLDRGSAVQERKLCMAM